LMKARFRRDRDKLSDSEFQRWSLKKLSRV